jgi:hypothetical protein
MKIAPEFNEASIKSALNLLSVLIGLALSKVFNYFKNAYEIRLS